MANSFQATRPMEHIAFFHFKMNTNDGPAYVFLAVDAFTQYAFHLGVEHDDSPKTVLKNIYFLLEHPELVGQLDEGFTLVLEEHQELSHQIEAILKPSKGKLLYNKGYNNHLSNPVLLSLRNSMIGNGNK